ncbi:hypothetical protein GGI25_000442 [Coemansia spiralis]|uniref:Zn(2)-C6 fungal-type domain-containing protein n=2 Tax=Coemansia TaxID=4863 RepID=A0A9W8GCC3_9FUNG|nr:hypothetical protein EDC05_000269 [Coemansia umbellata]KAJ2624158.1 hypothetical protein GGI26_001733 [Coemansia sp. RSA 1358]KAJ2680806.1 hypothetical protein GGI25_000442 [Coemansia spiralis]
MTDLPAEERPLTRILPQDTMSSTAAVSSTAAATDPKTDSPQHTQRHYHSHRQQQEQQQHQSHLAAPRLHRQSPSRAYSGRGSGDGADWYAYSHHGYGQNGASPVVTTNVTAAVTPVSEPMVIDSSSIDNSSHNRPASTDRTEGIKRSRGDYEQKLSRSHAYLSSDHKDAVYCPSNSSSALYRPGDRLSGTVSATAVPPKSSVAGAHDSSVSVSPAPSSSAATSSRDMQDSMHNASSMSAASMPPNNMRSSSLSQPPPPLAQLTAPTSAPTVVAHHVKDINTEQRQKQQNSSSPGGNNQNECADSNEDHGFDAEFAQEAEEVEAESANSDPSSPKHNKIQSQSKGQGGSNSKGSNSHQSQKRRLNQACLLCRRKKIRCDSSHPSCSNCQRRGIQCIYPEVRKRGRPPRMYTFADFALPGQPLPPELQGIANVHASAMLPVVERGGDQQSQAMGAPDSGGSGSMQHGWRSGAPGVSGGYGHGPSPTGGDISGTSTPAYAHSDYDHPSLLPSLTAALGRSSGHVPSAYPHSLSRGAPDPMMHPPPPLAVDQAVLDLFEYVIPNFPIVHRQTLVQHIRDRSMTLPLWLAIHAVSARFEAHHGGKSSFHHHHHHNAGASHGSSHRYGSSRPGASYAEKAHTILVNRFGQRHSRPVSARNERSRMAVSRDSTYDFDDVDKDMSRREVIELLQSLVLLSIYYSGNWELELAVETHAAAVRISQRMGVHLIDDPSKLQEANGIFNSCAALNQRKRAQSIGSLSANAASSATRWNSSRPPAPGPLPGGPNGVEMYDPGHSHTSGNTPENTNMAPADLRKNWIEFETLRRLWWAMFIMDRMYYLCAGSPRMIAISSFRVRLPCSDLEWDLMHTQQTTTSPTSATAKDSSQLSGLMVRTFREAVMHTSLSEQAANEIAATPSTDPDIYRYFAALAGLVDSVVDLGDDIRALASPSMLEGTEILAQLRAEKRSADYSSDAGTYSLEPGSRTAHARHGNTMHGSGRSSSTAETRQPSTATWLGSRKARSQFSRTSRSGWFSSSASSAWPPDWRSRMRVLQERTAALETQLTEWYSSTPIAQYARKPYLYSQLPLQDRITYFHQQIVYYGSVIQLQSMVLMAQGLLLPDTVDDSSAVLGLSSIGSPQHSSSFGLSTLTDMLWRSLMSLDIGTDDQARRPTGDVLGEAGYTPRRRQFGTLSGWSGRRSYRAGMDGMQGDSGFGSHGDNIDDGDDTPFVPLDEGGNSPEVVREELQRMVQAAWRRCTEAAIAMSTAVKRATEVRRVASANPNVSYYDPTFRPQVLPPYRGDVVSGDRGSPSYVENRSPFAAASSRYEPVTAAGEMRASPQQPLSSSNMAVHGFSDGQRLPPIDRRESGPSSNSAYPQQPRMPLSNSPSAPSSGRLVDSAAGPGQVIDDATLFMRFNMFTCFAAYTGAFIHIQNLRLTPRWEDAVQCYNEAAAKANDMRTSGNTGMVAGAGDGRDLGILPPPLPPQLPVPPCTPEQAREGVRPLVKMLEGMVPYWRVSGHIAKLRSMWREIEGSELPSAPLSSPPMRAPTHVHAPAAPAGGGGLMSGPATAPSRPMPMTALEHGQWGQKQGPKVQQPAPQHLPPPSQQQQLLPPPPQAQQISHMAHSRRLSGAATHQTTPHHQQQMSMFPPRP